MSRGLIQRESVIERSEFVCGYWLRTFAESKFDVTAFRKSAVACRRLLQVKFDSELWRLVKRKSSLRFSSGAKTLIREKHILGLLIGAYRWYRSCLTN